MRRPPSRFSPSSAPTVHTKLQYDRAVHELHQPIAGASTESKYDPFTGKGGNDALDMAVCPEPGSMNVILADGQGHSHELREQANFMDLMVHVPTPLSGGLRVDVQRCRIFRGQALIDGAPVSFAPKRGDMVSGAGNGRATRIRTGRATCTNRGSTPWFTRPRSAPGARRPRTSAWSRGSSRIGPARTPALRSKSRSRPRLGTGDCRAASTHQRDLEPQRAPPHGSRAELYGGQQPQSV